jgi:sugar phosphate isomerase/epimerase
MNRPAMRRLSLDHITVVDTTPSQLAEAAVGCAGMCLFLEPMAVLPHMPDFRLIGDTPERRATRDAMAAGGVTLDLVYPFTLTGRTIVADFEAALETTAWLGGKMANVLCYDRDPSRRVERIAELAALAGGYGIELALEFYPPSQIRSLADALTTIDALDSYGVGVTVDLLHLMRAGKLPGALSLLPDPRIRIAQLSDGPVSVAADLMEWEAGRQRALPGAGVFDIPAFIRALDPDVPLSVEIPQEQALLAGWSVQERGAAAVRPILDILELLQFE